MLLGDHILNEFHSTGIHISVDNAAGARRVTLQERERLPRSAPTTKVCLKLHICMWYFLNPSISEHHIQGDEVDCKAFLMRWPTRLALT